MPEHILFQFLASLLGGFVLWKLRKRIKLNDIAVYDFIVLSFLFAVVIGKTVYVLQNVELYVSTSWSFVPYYFSPQVQRLVWLEQMPWVLLRVWNMNMSFSGMLFAFILFSSVYIKKFSKVRQYHKAVLASVASGAIVLLVGFFIGKVYIGKEADLPFSIKYYDDNYRLPIQLFEILFFSGFIVVLKFFKDKLDGKTLFGAFLFLFGWVEIFIQYIKDKPNGSDNTFLIQLLYLFFVFVGIFTITLSLQKRDKVEEQLNVEVNKLQDDKGEDRRKKMRFSYRDFRSSYSNYSSSRPSIFAWIKRKINSLRNRE